MGLLVAETLDVRLTPGLALPSAVLAFFELSEPFDASFASGFDDPNESLLSDDFDDDDDKSGFLDSFSMLAFDELVRFSFGAGAVGCL